MKKRDHKIIEKRKQILAQRLDRETRAEDEGPVMGNGNIQYEMSDRIDAVGFGGLGAIHRMNRKLGFAKAIDEKLHLLKMHRPYHESDHVLAMAYNVLTGGQCLEDMERLRLSTACMNMLDARRIPDPTTAGDFTRRFSAQAVHDLMDAANEIRAKVWQRQEKDFFDLATVDIDGTLAPTEGECKEGMDISYKGIWGYAPLLISLANTREPLYMVNRPGNAPSHQDAAPWIDRTLDLLSPLFKRILLRGDTDFSLTEHLDRWAKRCDFIFGVDAIKKLVQLAESLDLQWDPFEREPKYEVQTQPRERSENVKDRIVRERGYKNIRLNCEHVAEFDYRPNKCERHYRIVVLRKNLTIERGETALFDEIRYFFYITTLRDCDKAQIVRQANLRCDQENLIGQMKSGLNAMRMPVGDLVSNWAYMVMASLAWSMKAWYGLLIADPAESRLVIRMEFKRFLNELILIPCQVLSKGRQLICRVLAYGVRLTTFFNTLDVISRLSTT
jgi:hypothetical protein